MARPGSVDKWWEFEVKRVNTGLVSRRKHLSALLKEAKPHCVTRDGETHEFDIEVLRRIAAATREGEELLLP